MVLLPSNMMKKIVPFLLCSLIVLSTTLLVGCSGTDDAGKPVVVPPNNGAGKGPAAPGKKGGIEPPGV